MPCVSWFSCFSFLGGNATGRLTDNQPPASKVINVFVPQSDGSFNGQQCTEALRNPEKDNRSKVCSLEEKYYSTLGQLKMEYEKKDGTYATYYGTAQIARFNSIKGVKKPFLLTAAHNLFQKGVAPERSSPKRVTFHWKCGFPGAKIIPINVWSVHDEFKKNKKTSSGWQSGGDVAVCQIPHGSLGTDPPCLLLDEQSIGSQKNKLVEIAGYPGEVEKFGTLWHDSGIIDEEGDFDKGHFTHDGEKDLMVQSYDKIDTTAGQSGSAVVKLSVTGGQNYMAVGVHVAGLPDANHGTAIKKSIFDWILKRVQGFK